MRIKSESDHCRIIETTAGVPVARIIRTSGWRWTMRILEGGHSANVTGVINDPAVLMKLVETLVKTAAKTEAETLFSG